MLHRSVTARAVRGSAARRAGLSTSTNALAPIAPGKGKSVSTEQAKPQLDPRSVSAFTGTPKEMLETRVVKIFKPAPGVQNATNPSLVWKMQWEDERTERWINPLMGWTSTRDPLTNTQLEFSSSEEAARFARNNGARTSIGLLQSHAPAGAISVLERRKAETPPC